MKLPGSKITLSAALLALALSVPAAHADLLSPLTVNGCSSGCGSGPFGTVTVHDLGDGRTVLVTLALSPLEVFAITGAGSPFGFNLDKSASLVAGTLKMGSLTTGLSLSGSDTFAGGLGTFAETIDCADVAVCGHGTNKLLSGPLTFELTNAGGLTSADFIKNANGFLFGADIGVESSPGVVVGTGVVGGSGPVSETGYLWSLTAMLVGITFLGKKWRAVSRP